MFENIFHIVSENIVQFQKVSEHFSYSFRNYWFHAIFLRVSDTFVQFQDMFRTALHIYDRFYNSAFNKCVNCIRKCLETRGTFQKVLDICSLAMTCFEESHKISEFVRTASERLQ